MAEVEIKQENLVYTKPELITDNVMHYCPGCSHGTVHKLIAEVVAELGLADKTWAFRPSGARCLPTIISTSTGSRRLTGVR